MSASTASGSGLRLTPPTAPHGRPDSKPKKPRLTHFLCIPLHNAAPQLTTSIAALQNDLVINEELVSTSAIRPVVTIHLTLGVMSLTSPALIQRAKEFLETDIDLSNILRSLNPSAEETPLTIDLRGLEAMGSRWRTSVLYAVPCDATGRLRMFAEAVRGAFEKEGLVVDEGRELKLHATVVNTTYSKRERESDRGQGRGGGFPGSGRGGGGRRPRNPRETFDAIDLVGKYKDITFADEVRLDKIAVCKMEEVRGEDGTSEGYLVCGEKIF